MRFSVCGMKLNYILCDMQIHLQLYDRVWVRVGILNGICWVLLFTAVFGSQVHIVEVVFVNDVSSFFWVDRGSSTSYDHIEDRHDERGFDWLVDDYY